MTRQHLTFDNRAGFRGGSGDPGPRPPTIEGLPPNCSYFIFFANESADDVFIDVLLQFASVTMYWNCSARRFCPPPIWLLEGPQGGAKKIPRLAIARHILRPHHKLWYNSTTTPTPLVGWEGTTFSGSFTTHMIHHTLFHSCIQNWPVSQNISYHRLLVSHGLRL